MWRKNTTLLFQDKVPISQSHALRSKFIRFDNRTLLINNVTNEDEGYYSCELAPPPANTTSKIVHFIKIVKGPEIESITSRHNTSYVIIHSITYFAVIFNCKLFFFKLVNCWRSTLAHV